MLHFSKFNWWFTGWLLLFPVQIKGHVFSNIKSANQQLSLVWQFWSQTIYYWAAWRSWRRTPSCQIAQISQYNLPSFPHKWEHGAKKKKNLAVDLFRGCRESKNNKSSYFIWSQMNYNEVGLSWSLPKPKLKPNHAHRICKVMSLHYVLNSVLLCVCWKCIHWWRSNLTIGEQPLLWPCWQALAFSQLFEDFSNIVALGTLPSTCVVLCLLCQKKKGKTGGKKSYFHGYWKN